MDPTNNITNQTLDFSDYDWLFITVGVAHILLVVLPVLFVGPFVLALFITNKKLRDSVFDCVYVLDYILHMRSSYIWFVDRH